MMFRFASSLDQPHDAQLPFVAERKSPLENYTPLNIFTLLNLLQPSLVGGPYWNCVVIRSRFPPLLWNLLEDPIFSNAFSSLFLTFSTRSPLSSHLFHSTTFWTYVGIAVITALISTSLPAWFKVFDLQPWSLSWICAFRHPNATFFDRPHIEGNPRYFPGSLELDMWTFSTIAELRLSSAPRLNVKVNFAVLIRWPDALQ